MSSERAFKERDKMLFRGDSDLFPSEEICFICGDPTGKAGIADDSLYTDIGDGPYCEECWDKNNNTNEDMV
jgi:hypothetical protein